MKKSKIQNISNIKLDFFLKQNKEDIRIVLNADESSWCDHGTTTKSMILYERKNLIRVTPEVISEHIELKTEYEKIIISNAITTALDLIPVQAMSEPDMEFFIEITCDADATLDKAKKEVEEYKEESVKKYKGKKRGRKKKRGPKPGSKKKITTTEKNI